MNNNDTTIKVKKNTLNILKKLGYFGESYDDVIQRLIKGQSILEAKKEKPKYMDSL